MNKITLLLILTFLIQSCTTKNQEGFYKGYETPIYQVTKKIDGFEFRNYPARLVAEIEVSGKRKEAAREGFMTLARYIFGKNITKEKVNMTSPVTQKEVSQKIDMTSPVLQIDQGDQKWQIQFSMPKKYNIETLPTPKDPRIKFKITSAKKIIAIRFASLWSDDVFNAKKEELLAFVKKEKIETKGLPIITYYDDPFTFPWNRRNEITLELK